MDEALRVILVGGTSHLGKTTAAQAIASMLGWKVASTDKLARHPGRPWQRPPFVVPPHVSDHYRNLVHDELIASVLAHYRSMLPTIETLVRSHAKDATAQHLVLEGSAILPEQARVLTTRNIAAVWLTGNDRLIQSRIYYESRYDTAGEWSRLMIDKFLERSRRFNRIIEEGVRQFRLPRVEVTEDMPAEQVAERVLAVARPSHPR
jgi:2-phosphoglycerate kinase